MQEKNKLKLFFLTFVLNFSYLIFAKEVKENKPVKETKAVEENSENDIRYHQIVIGDQNDGMDPEMCKSILQSFRMVMMSKKRFKLVEPLKADSYLKLNCTKNSIKMTWNRVGKGKKGGKGTLTLMAKDTFNIPPEWAKLKDYRDEVPSFSAKIMESVLNKIPWHGEITQIDEDPDSQVNEYRYLSKTSLGVVNSRYSNPCTFFEIGLVKGTQNSEFVKFNYLGRGILTTVSDFDSSAILFFDKQPNTDLSEQFLTFRFIADTEDLNKSLRRIQKDCQGSGNLIAAESTLGSKTLNKLLTGDVFGLFSSETIELSEIFQYVGANIVNIETDNDQAAKKVFSIFGRNRLGIGDLAVFDVQIIKSAKDDVLYDPVLKVNATDNPTKASISFAEAYVGPQLNLDHFILGLGVGVSVTKVNVPYEKLVVPAKKQYALAQRGSNTSPGGKVISEFKLKSFRVGLGSSFVVDKKAPLYSVFMDINLGLSRTWYLSLNGFYLKLSQDAQKAPGAALMGGGLSIGFGLNNPK